MAECNFFPFFPEKILKRGSLVLAVGALAAAGAVILLLDSPSSPFSFEVKSLHQQSEQPLSFDLDFEPSPPALPLPNIEKEMTFSFDPPRPDERLQHPPLFIRMIKNAQSKRIALPSRIDLQYENGLRFSETSSPFWMELRSMGDNQIEGRVLVSPPSSEKNIEAGIFVATAQESPIQSLNEFPEGSPFRVLAEARWWGHDLFKEKYDGKTYSQRIEIGPPANADLIELEKGDWIAWREGKWQKIAALSEGKNCPIAHFISHDARSLLIEGWDLDSHIRLSLTPAQAFSFKVKGEELFTSVRIRSEKQISCMLEKQCLILKVGDWVFKGEKRWRILRKKEEKDAYLKGSLIGELFVFDRIDMKGGQKVVQGNLFNSGRSQVIPIEITVNSQRRNTQIKNLNWIRKGKEK